MILNFPSLEYSCCNSFKGELSMAEKCCLLLACSTYKLYIEHSSFVTWFKESPPIFLLFCLLLAAQPDKSTPHPTQITEIEAFVASTIRAAVMRFNKNS